jgi:hypothetical protein
MRRMTVLRIIHGASLRIFAGATLLVAVRLAGARGYRPLVVHESLAGPSPDCRARTTAGLEQLVADFLDGARRAPFRRRGRICRWQELAVEVLGDEAVG